MAGHDFEARLCICCIDPSAIHPEPHVSTLGGCKEGHGISGDHTLICQGHD